MRRAVSARSLQTKTAVARELAHHGSPYVLGVAILFAALGRLRRGAPGRSDVFAVVAVLAVQPFLEWFLHRGVLHGPARIVAGRTIDVAAPHRGHHRVPDDVGGALLGGANAVADAMAIGGLATGLGVVLGGAPAAFTAVSAGEASLFSYEWAHLLHHSGYRPKSKWFRTLRASHLRHHFRDDTVDYGVTSRLADRVLGTRSAHR